MDLTTITGIGASVFTAVSLLPQLAKLIREKKPGGMSYLMLGALFIGVALWVWYGILKNDWIIIISNAFSLAVNAIIGVLSIKYRRNKQG